MTRDQIIETIARALIERRIRQARRWDTEPERLEQQLPEAIEYAWKDEVGNAQASLQALEDAGLPSLPLEPTDEMMFAGASATNRMVGLSDAYDIWKAMVSTFLRGQDSSRAQQLAAAQARTLAEIERDRDQRVVAALAADHQGEA